MSETSWNQYSKNCFSPSLEFNVGISSTLWQKWQLYDTLPGRKGNKESEKLCGITIVDSMRNYPTSVTNIFVFLDWLMYLSRGFIQKIATIFSRTFQRPHFHFQGPPIWNVISQIVQKCTFAVHSNRTLRLELFAPPTSLHFSALVLNW